MGHAEPREVDVKTEAEMGWKEGSTSQGTPRISSNRQEPGEAREGFSSEFPEGTNPDEVLILKV